MAEEQKCPKCGAELPANAPEGLCPRCLIKLGVQTGEQVSGVDSEMPSDVPTSPPADGGPDRFVPPEPAELAEVKKQNKVLDRACKEYEKAQAACTEARKEAK